METGIESLIYFSKEMITDNQCFVAFSFKDVFFVRRSTGKSFWRFHSVINFRFCGSSAAFGLKNGSWTLFNIEEYFAWRCWNSFHDFEFLIEFSNWSGSIFPDFRFILSWRSYWSKTVDWTSFEELFSSNSSSSSSFSSTSSQMFCSSLSSSSLSKKGKHKRFHQTLLFCSCTK